MLTTIRSSCFVVCALLALLAPGRLSAQKFAYSSGQGGLSEIYVVNIEGSGLTNVTNNPGNDVHPRWSPDGARILFMSDRRGGDPEPFVMNADGSGQRRLTLASDEDAVARWANDGTKILLTKKSGLGRAAYFANPSGSALTQIGALPANDSAQWSPDGSKILYTSGLNFDNPDWYVFTVASNSTTLTILDIGSEARIVGWSADSSRILVHHGPRPFGPWAIYDAASGARTYLSGPLFGYDALWSPDSSKILVMHDEEAGYGDNVRYSVVNTDGSGQLEISAIFDALGSVYNPTWSPDST